MNGFSAGFFELNTITTTSTQSGTKGLDSSSFGITPRKSHLFSHVFMWQPKVINNLLLQVKGQHRVWCSEL